MKNPEELFNNNKTWAESFLKKDPSFFKKLAKQQTPEYLWIGCSDSRVPATEIVGLSPGDMFVHRNVGNIVGLNDLNVLSVLQYAVEVLKVKHIIVCGHYGCGAVCASMTDQDNPLISQWIKNIRDVYDANQETFSDLSKEEKENLLCEFNVIEQVKNVARSAVVQETWEGNHDLNIHGWIYGMDKGLLKDLNITLNNKEAINKI